MNMHTHAQTVIHTWVESWSLVTQAADTDDASHLTVRWPHIHQRLVLRPSTSSPDVPSTDRWLSCIECTELEALWEYWPCTFLSPRTDLYKQKPPTPDPNSHVRGKRKGLKTAETGSIRIIFQKRKRSVCVCARSRWCWRRLLMASLPTRPPLSAVQRRVAGCYDDGAPFSGGSWCIYSHLLPHGLSWAVICVCRLSINGNCYFVFFGSFMPFCFYPFGDNCTIGWWLF